MTTKDSLERIEVELIAVRFRRVVTGRPEVLVAESGRFADARRRSGRVGSCRRRSAGVRRTDGDVSRLVDGIARVVTRPLVKRLATQRRRDDARHHDLNEPIDFVSSRHCTVYTGSSSSSLTRSRRGP